MKENEKIDYYETTGKSISEVYNLWLNDLTSKINDQVIKDLKSGVLEEVQNNENGFDLLYNQLTPKFKWFKPPLSIKIFKWEISMMWAYKIHKSVLLKNCIPIGMNSTFDTIYPHKPDDEDIKNIEEHAKEISLEFQCNQNNSDKVKRDEEKSNLEINENLANDYDGDYIWDKELNVFRAPKYPDEKGDPFNLKEFNFNNHCDLLEGNPKENPDDTQYPSCFTCHRFDICRNYYNKKLSYPSNSDNKENIMKYNFTKGILNTLLESEIELTNDQKLAILEMYPSIQIMAMKGEISFKNEKEENNKC